MIDKDSLPMKVQLLPKSEALLLRDTVINELESLRQEYFLQVPQDSYLSNYLNHESVLIKAAAYRWLTGERVALLKSAGARSLGEDPQQFYLHPIFYLRISEPQKRQQYDATRPLLESQPHYDRALGIFAYTFWLGLVDINEETGGLCFVREDVQVSELFHSTWDSPNRYNYEKYVTESKDLDPVLQEKLFRDLPFHAGDAYLFHSDILHAALRVRHQRRLSFDFRLIHSSDLEKAPPNSRDLVEEFNRDIERSNAYGLLSLGDWLGSEKCRTEVPLDPEVVDRIANLSDVRVPLAQMAWRNEYSWFQLR